MAISNVSINPPASSSFTPAISNAAAPFVNGAKSTLDKQASAIVTLSAQGQKLNQAASQPQANQTQATQTSATQNTNRPDTATTENVESRSRETAEAPGIQFMEGESKGGRVNTFA
jgi:hypothetical protein